MAYYSPLMCPAQNMDCISCGLILFNAYCCRLLTLSQKVIKR